MKPHKGCVCQAFSSLFPHHPWGKWQGALPAFIDPVPPEAYPRYCLAGSCPIHWRPLYKQNKVYFLAPRKKNLCDIPVCYLVNRNPDNGSLESKITGWCDPLNSLNIICVHLWLASLVAWSSGCPNRIESYDPWFHLQHQDASPGNKCGSEGKFGETWGQHVHNSLTTNRYTSLQPEAAPFPTFPSACHLSVLPLPIGAVQ